VVLVLVLVEPSAAAVVVRLLVARVHLGMKPDLATATDLDRTRTGAQKAVQVVVVAANG
jgi:hypothetical protein